MEWFALTFSLGAALAALVATVMAKRQERAMRLAAAKSHAATLAEHSFAADLSTWLADSAQVDAHVIEAADEAHDEDSQTRSRVLYVQSKDHPEQESAWVFVVDERGHGRALPAHIEFPREQSDRLRRTVGLWRVSLTALDAVRADYRLVLRDDPEAEEDIAAIDKAREHLQAIHLGQRHRSVPMPEDVGFRGPTAAAAAGITYRELEDWAHTGLVKPSQHDANRSGAQRLYSFRDVLLLKLVKRLLDAGLSMQQIRTAITRLRERGDDDLTQVVLMSDGVSLYESSTRGETIDLLQSGQDVIGIAIGDVWREVERTLTELPGERIDEPAADEDARRAEGFSRTIGDESSQR